MTPRAGRWGRHRPPLVVAHRGASRRAPENSLDAFTLAVRAGADAIELDVVRCASGEIVVFHDHSIARFTGDRRDEVRRLPYATLRTIDLGGGARIPTLDQALETIGAAAWPNVELKSWPSRALIDDGLALGVAETLTRHGLRDTALVSSFDPILLTRFSRVAPGVTTGLLFRARPILLRQRWFARLLRPAAIQLEMPLAEVGRVRRWHARGLSVHVWGVEDEPSVERAVGMGVDAIATSDPAMARRVILGAAASASSPDETARC